MFDSSFITGDDLMRGHFAILAIDVVHYIVIPSLRMSLCSIMYPITAINPFNFAKSVA